MVFLWDLRAPFTLFTTTSANVKLSEVSFLADLRASCTLFTTTSANAKHMEVSFLADLRTSCTLSTTTYGNVNYSEVSFLNRPPCVLHIIYNNLCDSEVRPTRDFIILNRGRTKPPRNGRAVPGQWAQNFSPISVPSPRLEECVF